MGLLPWTHDEALAAVRKWYRDHGSLPSYGQWARAGEDHPASKTIARKWGWHSLLADAVGVGIGEVRELMAWDLRPGVAHRPTAEIITALEETGREMRRAPTWAEWEQGGHPGRPAPKTVARRLGGWSLGLQQAGLDPRPSRRSEAWRRSRRERQRVLRNQKGKIAPVLQSPRIRQRLDELGFDDLESYLRHRYVNQGATQRSIAQELFGRITRGGRPEVPAALEAYGFRRAPRVREP